MHYDVIIIGAGQAGLSIGRYLKNTNLSFVLLDENREVGDSWRNRYDSLILFTPRYYSGLPDYPFQGNPDSYPTKDEVADYLLSYAKNFSLPIQNNIHVQHLRQSRESFTIFTNQGEFTAYNIIIATGSFQTPTIPAISQNLAQNVFQIHSSTYKNPDQLNEGTTLVVGGGNSGTQIALELSKKEQVFLSIGHKMKFLPRNIGHKSIFWYFDKLGIYEKSEHSAIGKMIKKQADPIFGSDLKKAMKKEAVQLKPKSIAVKNNTFLFEDNSQLDVDNVIWSTGFRTDYSWIQIPGLFDEKGSLVHERGVTPIKGLYFLGLPWQSSRGSSLIKGVGADAKYLFQFIVDHFMF